MWSACALANFWYVCSRRRRRRRTVERLFKSRFMPHLISVLSRCPTAIDPRGRPRRARHKSQFSYGLRVRSTDVSRLRLSVVAERPAPRWRPTTMPSQRPKHQRTNIIQASINRAITLINHPPMAGARPARVSGSAHSNTSPERKKIARSYRFALSEPFSLHTTSHFGCMGGIWIIWFHMSLVCH